MKQLQLLFLVLAFLAVQTTNASQLVLYGPSNKEDDQSTLRQISVEVWHDSPAVAYGLFCANLILSTHAYSRPSQHKSNSALAIWRDPKFSLPTAAPILIAAESGFQGLVNTTLVREVSRRTYGQRQNFYKDYLKVLSGKSTELWLKGYTDPAVAKALGKITKGAQGGKQLLSIGSSSAAAFVAKKFSDAMVNSKSPLVLPLAAFTALKALEQFSDPEVISELTGSSPPEAYQAADYWFLRPFIYKPLLTSTRYYVEKVIQGRTLKQHLPRMVNAFATFRYFPLAHDSARNLADSANIGLSKLITGSIGDLIISSSEVVIDAFYKDPEFQGFFARGQKVLVDLGAGVISNALLSISIPVTLVALKPRNIAIGFILYLHCFYGRLII